MTKIINLSAEDYSRAFPRPSVVYNSMAFTSLNAVRATSVSHMAITDNSGTPILGLTVGERDERMLAPFSAPFAMFDFNREHRAETMLEAARLLRDRFPGLLLTLPPAPYWPAMNAKTLLALLASGARQLYCDWNYHIDLSRDFRADLTSSNRNKLRRAEREGLSLRRAEPMEAYEIIRLNRDHKGYRLAMSAEQVEQTIKVVNADFFVVDDSRGQAQASAMVYHVAPQIAQLIYWGDIPQPSVRNAMTVLAALLTEHYRNAGFRVLDLGPSGGEGYPNLGLSEFKESLGAITSPKPTLQL